MKLNMDYLSDTELNELIFEVESGDMICAPPDIKSSVIKKLNTKNKKREYTRYCIQVSIGCAACIASIFLLSFFPATDYIPPAVKQEMYEAPTREDVLSSDKSLYCPSREEVLNEKSIIQIIWNNLKQAGTTSFMKEQTDRNNQSNNGGIQL